MRRQSVGRPTAPSMPRETGGTAPSVLRRRRRGIGLLLTGGLILTTASATPSAVAAIRAADCPTGERALSVSEVNARSNLWAASCSLSGLKVTAGAASAEVPRPGTGVIATALTTTGGTTLRVTVAAGGTVRARVETVPVRSAAGAPAPVRPQTVTPVDCDDHYAPPFYGYRHVNPDNFLMKNSPIPTSITKAEAENALRVAATNINTVRNGCGVPDAAAVGLYYAGQGTAWPQITAEGRCTGTPDDQRTVAFQTLPAGTLGVTCTWTQGTTIVNWDMAINYATRWWAAGGTCPNGSSYHLESIMTHEFGHVIGLDHAAAGHPSLVMHPSFAPCEARRILSWGEAATINNHY